MDKPTAKFWRVLLSKCYDMLDKVCLTRPHVSTRTWLLLLVNMIINFVGFLVALVLYLIGWSAAVHQCLNSANNLNTCSYNSFLEQAE